MVSATETETDVVALRVWHNYEICEARCNCAMGSVDVEDCTCCQRILDDADGPEVMD
jgi:hypothetical protein